MREIKFRAWHESDGGVMLFVGDSYGTTHPMDCCKYHIEGQPVTLMQYTGLRDCNGVEIYEGDVVIKKDYPFYGDDNFVELNYIGVIGLDVDGCYYELIVVSNRVRGCACGGKLSDIADQCEVIGNIYEHPHLLESGE